MNPPEQLPARSRGVIALLEDKCTVCMICARECPDWCIYIEGHQEAEPADVAGRRPVTHNVLDRFAIDFGVCMYCGICVETCPFDALHWAPTYDYPASEVGALVHERERLASWLPAAPQAPLSPEVAG
ncbi:MAG: NADH-quinone oxidoreductase subunit [Frankiales bacterium]|jgi:NADH-quinone oxidoreductase subunit I|nr:NADH-quinone oxidoreductase subunit [Frankiales bacterium]